jgi:cation diffusion facilitator CzcD-associated flavoprotein CzcO
VTTEQEIREVAVIGAGSSGLSTALSLRDLGLRPLLIDRADGVGSSWQRRYDRLRLNTGKRASHLPGRPYPKTAPTFPTRDHVVAHLETHANEDGIELRLGTTVSRIDRGGAAWHLQTSGGTVQTRQVVVATGYEHTPHLPEWPGSFAGELIHSSAYRNPAAYAGKHVLVVGAGSSALEICYDVATGGAAKAWLAVRTPPNIMLRTLPGGWPSDIIASPLFDAPTWLSDPMAELARRITIGDLRPYGLPKAPQGVFARGVTQGKAPAIVDKEVVAAIRARRIEVVPTIDRLDGDSVTLVDGSRLTPDAVICATGYRRGLEPVVGHLGVLDSSGLPCATGEVAVEPGLRFIGFMSRPSLIAHVAKESRHVARRIAEELSCVA